MISREDWFGEFVVSLDKGPSMMLFSSFDQKLEFWDIIFLFSRKVAG